MSDKLNIKKKEITLKILKSLYNSWPLAGGIYILVKESNPNDKMLDSLLDIMKNAVKEMKDGDKKRQIEEKIIVLEKFKLMEKKERVIDLKNLDKLLEKLDSL